MTVMVNIVSPPPEVTALHTQLKKKLEVYMEEQGYTLKHSTDSKVPAIVTVVNSSRVISDIKRDIVRVTGSSFLSLKRFITM